MPLYHPAKVAYPTYWRTGKGRLGTLLLGLHQLIGSSLLKKNAALGRNSFPLIRHDNNKQTPWGNIMTTTHTRTAQPADKQSRIVTVLKELLQVQQAMAAANREHAHLLHRLAALENTLSPGKR